ncbi:MAG: hypothetical protein GY792_10205 [Gammaproteobacteria bacterium]|nr:hypothetical protein [Gammaproteobacteria bacterium]
MAKPYNPYTSYMAKLPDHLERYLAICQQVYERMERDGSWPWEDEEFVENPDQELGDSNGDTVSPEDG